MIAMPRFSSLIIGGLTAAQANSLAAGTMRGSREHDHRPDFVPSGWALLCIGETGPTWVA
jgi:hypothetical protein